MTESSEFLKYAESGPFPPPPPRVPTEGAGDFKQAANFVGEIPKCVNTER